MQNKILNMLLKTEGFISGQEISNTLGISRQAVWKNINSLKSKGYEITSVTNRGYSLTKCPNYLNKESLNRFLQTKIIGKDIIVLDCVGSTNDYIKELGSKSYKSGTVVAAREQTTGKGRLGRVWKTKKDDGIAFSILLRPSLAPNEISAITPLVGLAMCKAIRKYTNINCMIKWPNDIISNNKKLVGILTEMSAEFDAVEYIVIGIGVNILHTEFPQDIAYKATSLKLETGKDIDQNEFLAFALKEIETELFKNNFKLSSTALDEYSSMCATTGKTVSFVRKGTTISGVAVGVESDGELKVMLSDGSIRLVNSGEVTVQGIY